MPKLVDYLPVKPTDKALYMQEAPTTVTIEELEELRKIPTYSKKVMILQIILFIVFGIPKIIIGSAYMLVAVPIMLICYYIWRTFGRPESWRGALKILWTGIARVFLFFIGFYKISYHGRYDSDARFIVANHTCFFDGWLFLPFEPRPLGKKELTKVPLLGEISDIYQGIPVDRSKNTGVTKILIDSAADKNSPVLLIFPEGASTSGKYMLRFHLGAFLSDLPVQPASVRYTLWGTNSNINHVSFFHHQLYQMIVFLGTPAVTININFFPPMSLKSEGKNDPRIFADEVSLRIANDLGVMITNLSSSAIFHRKEPKTQESKKE